MTYYGETPEIAGNYTTVRFLQSGDFVTPALVDTAVDVLIVGGGGGAPYGGGGGGGGGVLQLTDVALSGTMAVVVGSGGTGLVGASDSTFAGYTGYGGGQGGGRGADGGDGASGGGAGADNATVYHGGDNTHGGQGYAGGSSSTAYPYNGGGGGGAGGAGVDGAADGYGDGGPGITWHGLAVGGGGAGGTYVGNTATHPGTASHGGGAPGVAGTANTGGGGGGDWNNSSNGGSGIVVIRWLSKPVTNFALVNKAEFGFSPTTLVPLYTPQTSFALVNESAMNFAADTMTRHLTTGFALVNGTRLRVRALTESAAAKLPPTDTLGWTTPSVAGSPLWDMIVTVGGVHIRNTFISAFTIELDDHCGYESCSLSFFSLRTANWASRCSITVAYGGYNLFEGRLQSQRCRTGTEIGWDLEFVGHLNDLRNHRAFRKTYVTSDLDDWRSDQGQQTESNVMEVGAS